MIFERDEAAINFIEKFDVCRTSHLTREVYHNHRVANRRLKKMVDMGLLRCRMDLFTQENVYSLKGAGKKSQAINMIQWKHKLLRIEFYFALKEVAHIDMFEVEKTYDNLRCDSIFIYTDNDGNSDICFLEVELRNRPIDIDKYKILSAGGFRKYFAKMPKILYITDKQTRTLKKGDLEVLVIPVKFTQEHIKEVLNIKG